MLRIESGRDVFTIWLSVCTGAIVQYFTNSLIIYRKIRKQVSFLRDRFRSFLMVPSEMFV
jgi:hypothetical protein